jgi:hypothetical protein
MEANTYFQMKRRFTTLGLSPIDAGNLTTTIKKWINSSGVKWTVNRLKQIKLLAIKWIYDQPDLTVKGFSFDETGRIKGPFKVLFNKQNPKRVLPLLQSYTAFKSDELLPEQWDKFITAVEDPEPSIVNAREFWKSANHSFMNADGQHLFINRLVRDFINIFKDIRKHETKLEDYPFSKDRFKPILEKGMKSVPESDMVLTELNHLYSSKPFSNWLSGTLPWSDLYRTPITPKALTRPQVVKDISNLYRILMGISNFYNPNATIEEFPPTNLVGKISFLQEPGLKLRSVANPFRIFQVLLRPLGKCLWDFLKVLPWDATYDQERFNVHIQDHLNQGKEVFSVDLRSFTDNFPLDFQIFLILEFVNRASLFYKKQPEILDSLSEDQKGWREDTVQYLSLFYYISQGEWFCTKRPESNVIWIKGQPLGLYPSFPIASISHGMLLDYLCMDSKEIKSPNTVREQKFFVLGDDVVILDKKLYDSYRNFLNKLGSPISEEKTFISSNFCEFAGRIIDKGSAMNQFKWQFSSEDNFLDLLRNFGMKILYEFKPHIREVGKICAEIPDVISGHGLGFNPDGIPLTTRISKYAHLINLDPKYSVLRVNRSISRSDLENYMDQFSELHDMYSEFFTQNLSYLNKERPSTDDLLIGVNRDLHHFIHQQMDYVNFYHLDDHPKMIEGLINSKILSLKWKCSKFYVDLNYSSDFERFYQNVGKAYHLTISDYKSPTKYRYLRALFGI